MIGGSRSRVRSVGARRSLLGVIVVGLLLSAAGSIGASGASAVRVATGSNRLQRSAHAALVRIESERCSPARHLSGIATIPDGAIAFDSAGHQLALLVGVCIDHRGPYPFVLDTGAEYSTITTGLARKLKLHLVTPSVVPEIGGCSPQSYSVAVKHWSLGTTALAAQTLTAVPMAAIGGVRFGGLLGSDVLSRFGAVGLDFTDKTLTIQGPEARVDAQPSEVNGPTTVPAPAPLTEPGPSFVTGLDVLRLGSRVRAFVSLDIRGSKHLLVLDTGSVMTGLANATIVATRLRATGRSFYGVSLTCRVVQREYRVSDWTLDGSGVPLAAETVHSIDLGGLSDVGLFGMDALSRFGWVVVDYRNGRLTFG